MLQPGQRLDDYRIESLFASGGMGEIYLAEEVSLNRQVAIKVIRPEAIRYPDSEDAQKVTKLFRREATAIARLNHPYVLPLYRFGEATLDGIPLMYMVMPYCQEKSLTDWMQTHAKTVLSLQEVDYILRQAAEGLQYAHDLEVIHLDVKPSNFLVRYRADDASKLNLQLADFGVAKLTATTGMSQTVRGSLEYMAPEQWEGSPVFATDQYALATMIYKFLTGQAPFKGTGFEQLWHQHRYMQPQPPSTINPNIPPSVDNVLLRAMAKNPSERFPSV
ncbi:MAG: serine/threonine protein kinase, partial [Chloroflexi bacterium]